MLSSFKSARSKQGVVAMGDTDYGLGQVNGLFVHPNQVKVRSFIEKSGVDFVARGELLDIVNYARATKSGGWCIRAGRAVPLTRRGALGQINQSKEGRKMGKKLVRAAVAFVYGAPEL
jgi:hypothetical protein